MTTCCCIGPQNGDPVCPCRMKDVIVKDGRYLEVKDLGPVTIRIPGERFWTKNSNDK